MFVFRSFVSLVTENCAQRATLGAMVRENVPLVGRAIYVLRSINQMYYLSASRLACART